MSTQNPHTRYRLLRKTKWEGVDRLEIAKDLHGKEFRIDGGRDKLMELIDAVRTLAPKRDEPDLPVRYWKKVAGLTENSFKHFDSSDDRHIEIDAQDEARLMISDALYNHAKLDQYFDSLKGQ